MKVTDYIKNKINRFQEGYIFTYTDFNISVNKSDAVIKALNRMVESGKLRKLSKGRYYKPKITEFGELKPDVYQVVKDLLEKDGNITGYLTGYSIFNSLLLTTQVSNTIQIGSVKEKNALTRGMYRIRFIMQPNRITKENIHLLQILDSIKFIKEIPDTTEDKACKQIIQLIKGISVNELNQLKKLVMNYNASTRALTGAIIESIYNESETQSITGSLNPATRFNFSISEQTLPTKEQWGIK